MSPSDAPSTCGAEPAPAADVATEPRAADFTTRPDLPEPQPQTGRYGGSVARDPRGLRIAGRLAGWRGEPIPSEVAQSPRGRRGYERGVRMRLAAEYLGVWRPGCGIRVTESEREAARSAARAWLARGGSLDPTRPTPEAVRNAMATAQARRVARAAASAAPETAPTSSAPLCVA